ncbi:MAG: TrmH family RNA methyltransferase [Acidobacteria bacterium]|nr:MAG: TrmH family RNA methyltransferase [Acidobacteriota bacterium]
MSKNRWRPFRRFFAQLEELMRIAGERLAADRDDLARENGVAGFPAWQRRLMDRELVRRALDIPFFADLVRAAWATPPELARERVESEHLAPWGEEAKKASPSADREAAVPDGRADVGGGEPPPRLRSAERALRERTRSLTVVLDNLNDPLNASAVLRTVEALGLQELHICHREGRVVLNRAIHKGASVWLDVFWYRSAEHAAADLRARGYTILGADVTAGAIPLDEIPLQTPLALVFGNEQSGLSDEFRRLVDGYFFIPTCGMTSYLNVSVSVAISTFVTDMRLRRAGRRAPLDPDDLRRLRRAWYSELAGRSETRRREFMAYLDDPPEPFRDVRERKRR